MARTGKMEEQVESLQNENKSHTIVNEMLQQKIVRKQGETSQSNEIRGFICPKKFARPNHGTRKETNQPTVQTSNRYATLILGDRYYGSEEDCVDECSVNEHSGSNNRSKSGKAQRNDGAKKRNPSTRENKRKANSAVVMKTTGIKVKSPNNKLIKRKGK